MKRILYILTAILTVYCTACTPDRYEFREMGTVDMNQIREIRLRASHYQLLADGRANIEFNPLLINEEGEEVPDDRVDHTQINYYTSSGETIPRLYATSDVSLIGQEISVTARIKGRELSSNTVSFTVADPTTAEAYTEITVPIVFHLIESDDDITEYGGDIPAERIQLILDKINYTFSGTVSKNAMGVDTKIRFKAALYDPYGNRLTEPGINRIYVDEVSDAAKDQYQTFIMNQKALWPYDRYLNVWLISDRANEYTKFYNTISRTCIPHYLLPGTETADVPAGLTLTAQPENWTPTPHETGILYKLQSIHTMVRSFGATNENELVNCFGLYLGLLPTWTASATSLPEDYCTDTHNYYGADPNGYKKNESAWKLVGDYYFLAENIMDDPVGVHRSISLQQAERARWILEHCPERSAWKSDFAFTGK